jgi:hypothetical protein
MTLPTVQLTDTDHELSNTVHRLIERVIGQSYLSRTYAGNKSRKEQLIDVYESWIRHS